jgi:hypothetical protein
MTDGPDDLPLDWPTPEQRTRVDTRVRALRHRRLVQRSAAAGVAVALVVALLVVVRGGSSGSNIRTATRSSTSTTTTTTTTQPAIVPAPEPKGWRIVDFGDARLAIPPDWSAAGPGAPTCAPVVGDGVTLLGGGPGCPYVEVAPSDQEDFSARPVASVHDLDLYRIASPIGVLYAVPALGVRLLVHGVAGEQRVLDTLTSSTRRVVLRSTTWPAVPRNWRSLSFDGITLDVPPTMPITQVGSFRLPPGECSAVPFPKSGAFVGNGSPGSFGCTMIPAGVVPVPTDGVWMHTVNESPSPAPPPVDRKIANEQVRLEVAFVSGYGVPDLEPALDVTVVGIDGRRFPGGVRLGLGTDPEIARTILGSIRPVEG